MSAELDGRALHHLESEDGEPPGGAPALRPVRPRTDKVRPEPLG